MKKKEKLLVITIILLLFSNFRTSQQLGELKNSLYRVNNSISGIEGRIGNINSDIQNTLGDIRKSYQWIIDKDYKIINAEGQFKEAKVIFNWTFRELNKNEKVYLLYGAEESGTVSEWNKIEAIHKDGLNYGAEVDLSYKKNYQFQVLSQYGDVTKSEELVDIDLYDKLANRMDFDAYFPQTSNTEISVSAQIQNFFHDTEVLKIKEAKADIYYKGKVVKSIDLTHVAQKNIIHGDIESWEYEETFKSEDLFIDTSDRDISDTLKIQIVVKDYLDEEYKSEIREF